MKYPHCKTWADCKTFDEQREFIFGWGSLREIVRWITEHPTPENIEFALLKFFESGKREKQTDFDALLQGRSWDEVVNQVLGRILVENTGSAGLGEALKRFYECGAAAALEHVQSETAETVTPTKH